MYHYAYVNEDNICIGIYTMPTPISGAGYIAVPSNDQTLVGQHWNAELEQFEPVYYYAQLDEDNIVSSVTYSTTQLATSATFLSITYAQYSTVTGMYWNGTEFVEPPFSLIAIASTDEINVKDTNTTLSDKLDEMEGDIADAVKTVNGTAPDEDGNVVIEIPAGGGTAGADGEDGVTFTPSVSADGVLSWTNDGGLDNPAPVNIKGADGATGAAGADGADGEDGVSPTVSIAKNGTVTTITITDANGTHTATVNDGAAGTNGTNGQDGADGEDGEDGTPCTHYWSGTTLVVTSASGTSSANLKGDKGDKGDTGAAGADGQDFNGNLTGGILRLSGNQAAFFSGSQMVYGTNNYPTRIAGSAISATKTITVDSDRRLKRNIHAVDERDCADFINGINVKTFSYKGDVEQCIGVIAQEMLEIDPDIASLFVKQNADGFYGVKSADLVYPLIAAVQALSKRMDELEKA